MTNKGFYSSAYIGTRAAGRYLYPIDRGAILSLDELQVIREPENGVSPCVDLSTTTNHALKFDRDAIALKMQSNVKIGYVPAMIAQVLSPLVVTAPFLFLALQYLTYYRTGRRSTLRPRQAGREESGGGKSTSMSLPVQAVCTGSNSWRQDCVFFRPLRTRVTGLNPTRIEVLVVQINPIKLGSRPGRIRNQRRTCIAEVIHLL